MGDFVLEAVENFIVERWYLLALVIVGYLFSIYWKGRKMKRDGK
ncbi:MAG: hypothetical protein RDU14_16965 [Melioribacteraceae bacterium]|nr:hypothetical protein [Melioribacteraceae bacterium]